jgi:ribosomal protein S17E
MPKPHQEAAPTDDKSGKAAGESQPADKGGKKDSDNPSNGQSIAQVAGGENSKSGDSKDGKPKDGDERDSLIVDLKKENREMKKMIRDEVIPTIRDLQQQIKKGGTSADDALDELDALAKEWELEPKFVQKLASILLTKSKKQFEDEYLSDIKDIKKKTEDQSKEISNAQITGAISKEFDRVIADNPELGKQIFLFGWNDPVSIIGNIDGIANDPDGFRGKTGFFNQAAESCRISARGGQFEFHVHLAQCHGEFSTEFSERFRR